MESSTCTDHRDGDRAYDGGDRVLAAPTETGGRCILRHEGHQSDGPSGIDPFPVTEDR